MLTLFILLLLLVPGLGFLIVPYEQPDLETKTYSKLRAIASLKAEQIDHWLNQRYRDGQTLVNDPGFLDRVLAVLQGDRAARNKLSARLEAFRKAYEYEAIVLVDAHNMPVLQSGNRDEINILSDEIVKRAMRKAEPFSAPIFRDASGEKHIDYIIPLRILETHRLIGALIVHNDPEQFLFPYLQRWPATDSSGETLLVRREGDQIHFLNKLRHSAEAPMTVKRPISSPQLPAAIALQDNRSGVVAGLDYRGVPVLAAYQSMRNTDWAIIAKLDRHEMMAPLFRLVNWVMLISLFILGSIGAALVIVWRQQQQMYLLAMQAEKNKTDRALRYFYELPFLGMAITSAKTKRWLQFNDHLCEILGYPREELEKKTWVELTHPDDLEKNMREFERMVSGEIDSYSIDKRFIRKDGKVIHASLDARGIRRSDGKVEYFVTTVDDITQRKLAEQALRESEARLRTLVQTIPDLIWLKNTEGVYLACNSMFERLFGASEAAIKGKTDYDFVDRDQANSFREHDRRAMQAGRPSVNEEWLNFGSGGYAGLFETIKTPMFNDDGEIIGVLGIARDITERKRLEEERRESLGRLEKIAGQLPGMVYQYQLYADGRHCIPYSSDAIEKIFRVTPEQVREDASIAFTRILEADVERLRESIQQSAQQLSPWRYEFRVKYDDDGPRWLYAKN